MGQTQCTRRPSEDLWPVYINPNIDCHPSKSTAIFENLLATTLIQQVKVQVSQTFVIQAFVAAKWYAHPVRFGGVLRNLRRWFIWLSVICANGRRFPLPLAVWAATWAGSIDGA
jgi:hypothetical protein